MSSDTWTLADLAAPERNAIVGGPFGSNLVSRDYTEVGVPVIRGQNMGGKWVSGDFVYVSEEKAKALNQNLARPNDLVFTQRGTLGQVSIVPHGRYDKYVVSQSQMKITVDPDKADVAFLYYLFKTPEQLQYILNSAIQTGVPHTNLGILKATPVKLPPLSVQKGIAVVLSALDDRITLLRETNATLEAIAQALFKSWFVDFDPVRARQEGRAPEGMDEATAALFPDGFEESELGAVPRGWRVGKLEDLLVLQRGFDLPASDRVSGDFPIIAASGPSGSHHIAMAKAPGVVTGRSGVLGRVFLELEDYWPLNTTLWVKDFRAATPCYAYEVLKLLDFASFNAGSAVPTLNRNHVHSLPYLIPDRECIDAYEPIAMAIHSRVRANQHQAQTLATLRDTLLPRLISGQLRLPEAEAAVAAAL
jgi:type I restriction enzyme, S subunit